MSASNVKKRFVTGLRRVGATILAATTAAMTVASGGVVVAFASANDSAKDMCTVSLVNTEAGSISFKDSDKRSKSVAAGTDVNVVVHAAKGANISAVTVFDSDGNTSTQNAKDGLATVHVTKNVTIMPSGSVSVNSDALKNVDLVDDKSQSIKDYVRKHADSRYVGKASDSMGLADGLNVTTTVVDGTKLPDATLAKLNEDADGNDVADHDDALVNQTTAYVALYDAGDGDYYVGRAFPDMQGAKVTDMKAAKNNANAEMVDDVIYDKATGLVYVPKSYTTDKARFALRIQLVVTTDGAAVDSVSNMRISADNDGVKGSLVNNGSAKGNLQMVQTDIKLSKTSGDSASISSDMIDSVEVNGFSYKADDGAWAYDEDTGVLTIGIAPFVISDVKVNMSDTFSKGAKRMWNGVLNMFGVDAKADTWVGTIRFPSTPSVGQSFVLDSMNMYQRDGVPGYLTPMISKSDFKKGDIEERLAKETMGWEEAHISDLYEHAKSLERSVQIGAQENNSVSFPAMNLNLVCSHVNVALPGDGGGENNHKWVPGKAHVRVMAVDGDSLIIGVTIPTVNTQAGAGFFRAKWELTGGHLALQKQSANPSMTNGNNCYSLVGAKYGVYSDAGATNKLGELTVASADGKTGEVFLPAGHYYVKELPGTAKGYHITSAIRQVYVTSGQHTTVALNGDMAEPPLDDPIGISVQKAMEGFSEAGKAEGDAPDLSGIQFQVDWYPGLYNSADAAKRSGNPKASAVFATDARGRLIFATASPVSGNWPYHDPNGYNTFPLGSVVITEKTAKAGVNVAHGYSFFHVVDSGDHVNATVTDVVQLGNGASSISTTENTAGGVAVDSPWLGGLTIVKADNDMNVSKAQGDGSIVGVTYDVINRSKNPVRVNGKIYNVGDVVMTIKTSRNNTTKRYEATTGERVLPYGTYEVKETWAPDSYKNANFDKTFYIRKDGQMISYDADTGEFVHNKNAVKRGGVAVTKFDRQSHQSKPEGESHLDGATFEIVNKSSNHDGGKVVVDGKTYNPGEVVKTISTEWDDGAKAYVAKTSANTLPYGTYTVREVGTSKGYLYDTTSQAWTKTFSIRQDGQMVKYDSYDTSVSNQVIREDWNFKKKADDSAERMNNVAFLVTSQTTGEKHVIVADENGTWGSSWNAHTQNTNTNDPDSPITNGAIKIDADGNYYVADSSKLDAEAGTWFTGYKPEETTWAANGKSYKISGSDYDVPVDDALRAFPYDTYTVQELRSNANEGYGLVNVTVTLHKYGNADGEGLDIDYGTLDDQPITIGTELLFGADHMAPATKDVELTDTITYSGLSKNEEYDMYGELHKVSADGKDEGVVATSTEKFTPKQNSGKTKVTFTLDASGLGGSKLVAYEYVKSAGQVVAKHEDIEDDDQTVVIPKIGTTLSGDIDHEVNAAKQTIKLVDTVKYEGLVPGKNYILTGTLMDKATGQALTDANGNPITASTVFSPFKSSGQQDVVFMFSDVDMAGKTVVAFESLNVGDIEYATHADINDTDQTVTFPKVRTTAQTSSKTKEVLADKDQKVVDTVKMSNLIAGKKYTLTGTLHLKNPDGSDGGELKDADGKVVTVTKEFTASGKDDESQDIEFTVDASALGGQTLVAFETLSRDKVTVGLHADMTDNDQTVVVPKIGTTMTDANGSHEVSVMPKSEDKKSDDTDAKADDKAVTPEAATDKADAKADSDAKSDESGEEAKETVKSSVVDGTKVTLTDTVAYDNLIVGQKYTVNGTLHVQKKDDKGNITDGGVLKDSDGKEVTASAEFTPEKTSSTVDVTFMFDAGDLSGQSVVAFEDVKNGDVTVATHADITDENQTVHFVKIGTKAVDTTTTTKTIGDAEKVSITDTVEYKNLIPGNTYTVNGALHIQKKDDKGNITDGGVLKDAYDKEVTATASFSPDKADGFVDVKFEFTTKLNALDGQTLVAFEDMKRGDVLVATHSDITDENQAVHGMKIGTTLTSVDGKTKEIGQNKETKLVDVVKFENLNIGETYTIKGKLVDGSGHAVKGADGKEVTAEGTFTPKKSVGTANVNFTVDTSAMTNGTKLVAYEYVYAANGTLVGKHEDVTDKNQTVTMKVETPPEKPGNHVNLQTGIKAYGLLFALGLVAAAVIGGTYAYRKRHGAKA